ncbi:YqhG family protein [Paenibacillus silvisoli]|uniref:YqhG family protein n=1 Tax=Paenibacillus silvisoli TaxID=3110539 RepID=UPI0028047D7D|nr:YqhG family protein [Paenibacillus silvisoli]
MNERQIHKFVQRYIESTNCHVIEKSPAHFQIKLSPRADRDLTNRPYYWSFVDRTGADPETMTMLFVTDKQKYDQMQAEPEPKKPADSQASAADAALNRSFGHIHGTLNTNIRVPREDLYFGSRRLNQLFDSARTSGSYLCLFQEPDRRSAHPLDSTAYSAWLGVNMKVEFACDMKREEIHSFGVSLATGQCVEQFHNRLLQHKMTPKLPPNVHTAKNALTLNKAAAIVEQTLERKLRTYDYSWAQAAAERLNDELATIKHYYEPLLESAEEENKPLFAEQFERRQEEIRWQYEPRVTASAINCGIFYLQGIG